MIRIIAYDICNSKRLRKVAKTCELYGMRIEKSVFECDLTEELFKEFWHELGTIINQGEDFVIAYPMNQATIREILSLGLATSRSNKPICYVCGC